MDSEALDELKYVDVKGKWKNWERGVDVQIFVVSTIDPSDEKKALNPARMRCG